MKTPLSLSTAWVPSTPWGGGTPASGAEQSEAPLGLLGRGRPQRRGEPICGEDAGQLGTVTRDHSSRRANVSEQEAFSMFHFYTFIL